MSDTKDITMATQNNITELNRIKIVLTEQGRTGQWLSKQLGKHPSTVSQWCSNKVQPTLEVIDEISKHLGIDRKDLINSSK